MKTYKMTVKAVYYCDVVVQADSEEEAEELAWDGADFGTAYDIDCLNVWGKEIPHKKNRSYAEIMLDM